MMKPFLILDAKIIGNLFGLKLGMVKCKYSLRWETFLRKFKNNLIEGLIDVGINVTEIGLCPTPLLYYSCFE